MSFDSADTKELVRQAIDIVDLVGRHIQLRRQGRHYVGLCPWHDDTRPSLQVNPERQSFKCWVCDIGGDIFTFVEKIEGVTFPEALAMLADQAGIPLKPLRSATEKPSDKRFLYRAMAWAEGQYHECLMRREEGEPARRYFKSRGITSQSARKFHLGYSPSWDWIVSRATGTDFGPTVLEAIGILAQPSEGQSRAYDRFGGRVLFSIRDAQGRPVGLGGRLLPESGSSSRAKYVNSPESMLFHKSKLLYALDLAKDAIRKNGRTAVVMEGYTDCIAAHQHGFENAVAVLGTALGQDHIGTLRPHADHIILVLDGDSAGQRRANEVLELFVAKSIDLKVVTLPDDLDPCDFLAEHGVDAFRDILSTRAVDALEHCRRVKTRGLDLDNDIHGASKALEEILAVVAKAPRLRDDTASEDRFREEKLLQRLSNDFRVREKDIRDRLIALRRAGQRRAVSAPARPAASDRATDSEPPSDPAPWQRELLEILIQFPEHVTAARAEIHPEDLAYEPCRRIYDKCCELSDGAVEPTFERLMLAFDEPALKSLLVELDETGRAKQMVAPLELLEAFFATYRRRKALAPASGRLEDELLFKMARELRARHGISPPTDGQDQARVDRSRRPIP